MERYFTNRASFDLLRKVRDRADTYWNDGWTAFTLLAVSFALSWHYLRHTPPPGYAIAVLAFAAAIMSVRENTPLQKGLWLTILAFLLRVEFKAIKIDRDATAREQSERFVAQQQEFSRIALKVDTSIDNNNKKFGEAAGKAQSILTAANTSQEVATSALNEMTGTGSYPYVAPQSAVTNQAFIPLALYNGGKSMLTNVAVIVHRSSDFTAGDDLAFETKQENIVGVVNNAWPRILKETISPHLDPGDEADMYIIEMYTAKALYSETLHFYRAKNGRWTSRYFVQRQFDHTQTMRVHGVASRVKVQAMVCQSHQWPDEYTDKGKALAKKVPYCGGRRECSSSLHYDVAMTYALHSSQQIQQIQRMHHSSLCGRLWRRPSLKLLRWPSLRGCWRCSKGP